MKTAMQELLEIINNNLKNEYTSQEFARLTIFKASAERLLEKEKEQIINARNHWKEQESNAFDDDFIFTGEEYYNKMYNNK
jgi:type IV secretory pathway TrbL component